MGAYPRKPERASPAAVPSLHPFRGRSPLRGAPPWGYSAFVLRPSPTDDTTNFIAVLAVDDHPLFIEGIAAVIGATSDIHWSEVPLPARMRWSGTVPYVRTWS